MKDATSTAAKAAKAAKAMKAMKDAKAAKAAKAGKPMKAAHSQGAKAMHADHSQGVRPTKIRVKRWSAVGFGWRLVPRPPRVRYVRTYVRLYLGPPHTVLFRTGTGHWFEAVLYEYIRTYVRTYVRKCKCDWVGLDWAGLRTYVRTYVRT